MYGEPQKEQWRDATAYVKSHASSQDILVLIDGDCRVPLDYYLGDSLSRAELGQRIEVSRSANDDEAERGQVMGEIVRARNEAQRQGGRLWLLVSHASSNNLESALDELPGLSRVETIEWVGIRLVSYVWA